MANVADVAVYPCGHQQFTVASTAEHALHVLLHVSSIMHRKGVYIENGIAVLLSQA